MPTHFLLGRRLPTPLFPVTSTGLQQGRWAWEQLYRARRPTSERPERAPGGPTWQAPEGRCGQSNAPVVPLDGGDKEKSRRARCLRKLQLLPPLLAASPGIMCSRVDVFVALPTVSCRFGSSTHGTKPQLPHGGTSAAQRRSPGLSCEMPMVPCGGR